MTDLFKSSSLMYKGLFITLVFLFLFLPSINQTDFVNSTITSKTIFFIYTLIIILSFKALSIFFNKNKLSPLKVSKIDISVSLIFIFIVINRYIIQLNYGFSIRFIELLGLAVLYIILRGIFFQSYIWLLLAIIVSGIIQAVYGNLQLLGYYSSNHSGFKITGSFFNPGPYAGFLVAVWSIALGFYLFKEQIVKHVSILENKFSSLFDSIIKYVFEYVPLIGVITIALVIPATQSRASWLAIIISSILLLELKYRILKKVFNKINTLKKAVLIICSVFILGISLFGVYHFKKGSSDGRLFIWKVSTEIIKEYPVFGVGFDRFKAHYMNAQANYFAKNGETQDALVADNTYYAFNEFIQFISENGFIGFILLIIMLYMLYKTTTLKENEYFSAIIKSGLLAISVFAFFSYPMEILPVKVIIICLVAILAILDSEKNLLFKIEKSNFQSYIIKTSIAAISLASILMSAHYINYLNTCFKTWQLALSSYQYGDYEAAIDEYKEAYPYLKNNGDFLMNYGKALSIYKQDEKAVKILLEAKKHLNTTIIETALGDSYKNLKQYDKAEKTYKHAANMISTRFYPLYLLAKLYDESEQNEKAVAIAKKILDKDIKVPSTAIKEIRQEMKNIISQNDK